MQKYRLLIVEDDPNLGEILNEYLQMKGFETVLCRDGAQGWETLQEKHFDLYLLDVMMPRMDGFTLAKNIRKKDDQVPILFLTAKSMKEDTIEAFKIGADDYVTKPFSMEELLLRINAILKRSKSTAQNNTPPALERFELGRLVFDVHRQELIVNGEIKKLTGKEGALLEILCRNLNQTVDKNDALRKIWGDDSYFHGRSMDVYLTKLRKLLKIEPKLEIITVHGQGYRLVFVP
jgi:DNA-binding response OmpR family regulator